MKKLYLSLIAGALISSFILGWLIDHVSEMPDDDSFVLQKQLVDGFAAQIAAQPKTQRVNYTNQISEQFNLDMTFHSNANLAMPPSVINELKAPGGLVLEDEVGFYVLKSTSVFPEHHIQLRLDKPNQSHSNFDLFLTVGFYFGICIFMWVWLSPLTTRLSLLNQKAIRFANGDLSARIDNNRLTYIKDVEVAFNRMASQIQKLIEENQLLASSLSHDIRTPVACLRFGLDAAIDARDEEKRTRYLQRMEDDLDQMECMLDTYLEFATLEQKSQQINPESFALEQVINISVAQVEPKVIDKQLSIDVNINDVFVVADSHWLSRALTNLLSNACDFATSKIMITVTQTQIDTFIEVEDDGPGIDNAHIDKVLQPFYQQEKHRNRAGKNYGLGLAIVAKVIDWHFGSIQIGQSTTLHGAKFTIRLPRTCPRQQHIDER